jgi:hypothetical protein
MLSEKTDLSVMTLSVYFVQMSYKKEALMESYKTKPSFYD